MKNCQPRTYKGIDDPRGVVQGPCEARQRSADWRPQLRAVAVDHAPAREPVMDSGFRHAVQAAAFRACPPVVNDDEFSGDAHHLGGHLGFGAIVGNVAEAELLAYHVEGAIRVRHRSSVPGDQVDSRHQALPDFNAVSEQVDAVELVETESVYEESVQSVALSASNVENLCACGVEVEASPHVVHGPHQGLNPSSRCADVLRGNGRAHVFSASHIPVLEGAFGGYDVIAVADSRVHRASLFLARVAHGTANHHVCEVNDQPDEWGAVSWAYRPWGRL